MSFFARCASKLRCLPHSRGFSLVELMIALVLGMVVTGAVLGLFSASGQVEAMQMALSRVQENGRVAIGELTADLRTAGYLPCGAQISPLVYTDSLPTHVEGQPLTSAAPAGAAVDKPYLLDRSVFLEASCDATSCPAPSPALGVPEAGHGVGERVPATDILTLRHLQGTGWRSETLGAGSACKPDESVSAIVPEGLPQSGFDVAHLALLASCTQMQIFAVDAALRPLSGKFGLPKCDGSSSQPLQLFDFDAQLQTSVYYLQVVEDPTAPQRRISALMRRTNGIVNEVVQGVERFDLLFSVRDAAGNTHWLSGRNISSGTAQNGTALLCGAGAVLRACSWADVVAVDVDLLVNSIDDVPLRDSDSSLHYRYSPDGDGMQKPGATMPMTGMPSGRVLRREFRSVVALRSFAS